MRVRRRKRVCATCGAPAKGGLFCRTCGSRLDDGAAGEDNLAEEWSPRFLRAVGGMRDRAWFALAFVQARSNARRRLGVIDAELRRLRGERQQLLLGLGDATYRGDKAAAAQARKGVRGLDERIEEEYEKQRRVVDEASSRIEHERKFVAPTEIVDSSGMEEPEPTPKETA